MIFIPVLIFIFGLLIGSFLNVAILRMNTGRSMVTGRSACARCNKTLSWYELIPVLSYLGLRGKCSKCKTHISFQYPIVELVTAITFVILYMRIILPGWNMTVFGLVSFVFACAVAALLIVITVYDFRHKIIPDGAVYTFILLALGAIVWRAIFIAGYLPGAAIVNGVVVALPFFLLWACSQGRLMGFGDVKLALGIGWLLGLSSGFAALILAFWFGGVTGIFLLAGTHKYGMKSQIPFAPFLIAGLAAAVFFGINLQSIFPLW